MNKTLEDVIHEAMAKMLRLYGLDVKEVTGFDEDSTYYDSGCSCGGTTEYEVTIYYSTSIKERNYYIYRGKFGDLIQGLTVDD